MDTKYRTEIVDSIRRGEYRGAFNKETALRYIDKPSRQQTQSRKPDSKVVDSD